MRIFLACHCLSSSVNSSVSLFMRVILQIRMVNKRFCRNTLFYTFLRNIILSRFFLKPSYLNISKCFFWRTKMCWFWTKKITRSNFFYINTTGKNRYLLNVLKWPDTLWKSCSSCCKILKVCLTISGRYSLKA